MGKALPFTDVLARRPDGSPVRTRRGRGVMDPRPQRHRGLLAAAPVRDADGWFPTGDVGSIDADGYLCFLDRVSPRRRRAFDGRVVVAPSAGARLDPAEVLARFAATLRPVEVPSAIRPVDAIPRNAAGKVRRADLRTMLSTAPDPP